jgi:tungstate transport system permease protein
MSFLWEQFRSGISLIADGDPYLLHLLWLTIRVAVVSTVAALVIGLPIGLTLGLGRFRGRRALQVLANALLALPPVVVGITVLLLLLPPGPLGSLRLVFTVTALYIVQTILALPYIIALTPAAIQGLPPGLLSQARALGASRHQLSLLALREAKLGVLAGVMAAFGAAVSEVGAVIIVGGNTEGHTELLASSLLARFTFTPNDPTDTAIALLLLGVITVPIAVLTILQQRRGGLGLRFHTG